MVSDFSDPLGTRPKEALPDFGVRKMAHRTTPPSFLLGLFRGAPLESETTFVVQLFILFRKCGLRFLGRESECYELDAKNPTSPLSIIHNDWISLIGQFLPPIKGIWCPSGSICSGLNNHKLQVIVPAVVTTSSCTERTYRLPQNVLRLPQKVQTAPLQL